MSCHCDVPVKMADYESPNIFNWCTNCGNYGIHGALRRALKDEELNPCEVLLCFDIGCHGNHSDKIEGYRFHGLHGRIIPFACGAALTNRKVKTIAFGGDGGTLGEGINHLIAAIRANYNVTFLLHNNLNYGLTTGQASPTTKPGTPMNTSPDGITVDPLHPLRLVLGLEATFVARTFSGDIKHMTEVFKRGLRHKGFSFIEIYQSCPTYNKQTPHEWYQQRVYDVSSVQGYNPRDLNQARAAAEDLENHVAVGVLYENPDKPPFLDRQPPRAGAATELVDEVRPYDVQDLLEKFK